MSNSHIKKLIIDTSVKCAKMTSAVVVPKINTATMELWAYLINEIAHEYHVTFYNEPRIITNSVAESINCMWMSAIAFIGSCTYSSLLGRYPSPWESNVIHNAYFTWRVGHCMDTVFAENYGREIDYIIANQIINQIINFVGYLPNEESLEVFLKDVPLSILEIKN